MYILGTTYLHILLHCTLYLIAHLTPYFISLFVSYFILTIFVYIYIYSLVFCFIVFYCFYVIFILLLCFIYFLHFPLSGPVLTNISLLIIPCMIVYVTNNKEPWPWTLNLASKGRWMGPCTSGPGHWKLVADWYSSMTMTQNTNQGNKGVAQEEAH